tara:strand:+ start:281549 stop:282718 length:1170 start_codon:yes stop_codon:yes gene_type:complete
MSENISAYTAILKTYPKFKETTLSGRYITTDHILPLLNKFEDKFELSIIGQSTLNEFIYSIQLGSGKTKILMWSQMHGNESTTTKAIFDLLNAFYNLNEDSFLNEILDSCSLYIIPILNPDGAKAYTRVNANEIDLNRDANDLKEIESKLLRKVFDEFKPDFCFNLHDQRSIFSAGSAEFPATLSFLTPSMDPERRITPSREISMKVIAAISKDLYEKIPNRIGRYDDAYNSNCTGDTFQSLEVPTILFEAGHIANDYLREQTREYVLAALISGLYAVSTKTYELHSTLEYFEIPQNEKFFYDVILRNAIVNHEVVDIAIQYKEILKNGRIIFQGIVENIASNLAFYAHLQIDCKNNPVTLPDKTEISENVIVDEILFKNEILMINYEK